MKRRAISGSHRGAAMHCAMLGDSEPMSAGTGQEGMGSLLKPTEGTGLRATCLEMMSDFRGAVYISDIK